MAQPKRLIPCGRHKAPIHLKAYPAEHASAGEVRDHGDGVVNPVPDFALDS